MTQTLFRSLQRLSVACAFTAATIAAQTADTGRIAGRVTTPDGAPVRRAIVKLEGPARAASAVTDDGGAFVFERVPAGQVTLSVMRAGFIPGVYGANATGRPGTPLALAAGQQITNLTIVVARGAVITGTVRGVGGDPVPNAPISVIPVNRPPTRSGPFQEAPLGSDPRTDDRGVYRAFGLEPGSYVVSAAFPSTPGGPEVGRLTASEIDVGLADLQQRAGRFGRAGGTPVSAASSPARTTATPYTLAPIYYPGTADPGTAATVTVAAGEERTGIDIELSPVRSVSIEGVVANPYGLLPPLLISIGHERTPALVLRSSVPTMGTRPSLAQDGRFTYTSVAPGNYVIAVRSAARAPGRGGNGASDQGAPPPDTTLWASAAVTVTDADISGLILTLRALPRIKGHMRFDGATQPVPTDLSATRLTLEQPQTDRVWTGSSPNSTLSTVRVAADGAFDLGGVSPGTYQVGAALANPGGWWLRSVTIGGRDVLDTGLEVNENAVDISDAAITFTDRHTVLSGRLESAAGSPATAYVVVAFTTERSFWRPRARRVVFTRPATDGEFSFRDLPPGRYYLAALTDIDPNDWQTPDFLDQIVPASLTITLGEGEQKRQDLRLK